MLVFWIILGIILGLTALFFATTFVCFLITFYVTKKQKSVKEFDLPPGEIYKPFHEQMLAWMKETKNFPHEEVSVTSFDGLTLFGKYFECEKGAPIELMFPGYRGNAERDLCGGVQRCFALKRNVLLVDQRACGKSDGKVISFGINERKDCAVWVDYLVKRFGLDVKIILTGISMGAATVLMASVMEFPENVIGVIADCGYTSAKDIIKKCIKDMHLSAKIMYPFVKLGARIYGRFNLEETSPKDAMQICRLPVIFFHGEADDFVPCEMSVINYDACITNKKIVTVPDAGHGLSYIVDSEKYLQALKNFERESTLTQKIETA